MSTAPEGWQTPKTNWGPPDPVGPSDLSRFESNAAAIEAGDRTLDQAQIPSGHVGTLRQILSWFANRLRAILGTTHWYDNPPTTLLAAKEHIESTGVHGATSVATPDRIMERDTRGQARVTPPQYDDDIALLGTLRSEVGWVRPDISLGAVPRYTVPGSTYKRLQMSDDFTALWRMRVPYAGTYAVGWDYEAEVGVGGSLVVRLSVAEGDTDIAVTLGASRQTQEPVAMAHMVAAGQVITVSARASNSVARIWPPSLYFSELRDWPYFETLEVGE